MSVLKLELTEEQAHIVSKACEFFARIRMGQYMEIVHNCLDVKQEHYSEKREALSRVLLHAREFTHPDLERNFGHSYGMGKYEDADRAFDVHQVIRHALGDDREPFSHYDLPKCEAVPDKMEKDESVPVMDVAEVVRCKDCKKIKDYGKPGDEWLICRYLNQHRFPDDFCSRGVRRCRDAAD